MLFKSKKERVNKSPISILKSTTTGSNKNTKDPSDWSTSKTRARKKQELEMNKSNTFSINFALDYTCHRSNGPEQTKSLDFCGHCNSCQIINHLNHMKQWFNRASHVVIKEFLINLVMRINNMNIYRHLDDLLRPIAQSKDYLYARNKYLPSNEQDQFKATNNRCLSDDYVNKQIESINVWYTKASSFIKLNFMLSLLNKCDQAIVFEVINKIKSILDSMPQEVNAHSLHHNVVVHSHKDHSIAGKQTKKTQFVLDDVDAEIVLDAFDEEEDKLQSDEEKLANNELNKIFYEAPNSKHVDFIRQLPVHLSKLILKSLNKKSLYNCLFVSKYWYNLIKEVHKETILNKALVSDILLLRGTASISCNPKYANNVDVKVPNLHPGTFECILNAHQSEPKDLKKLEHNWQTAYIGYSTRNIIMEERNVFCGPYNVLLLKEKRDAHRVIHFDGKSTVAYGSFDKKIRIIDLKSAIERNTSIQGHAGSIKCIYVCESKRMLITGSYDCSIRCWSIATGKCLRIFQGHQQTVTCLTMHDALERIISGSTDKTCKIWLLDRKKCWRTFKHMYAIVSVAMNEELCVTGGVNGKIKVFDILSGQLVKTISAHNGWVTAVKFDRWHLLTCSTDGYCLVYSTQGKHKNCLMSLRHPKEVLCLEFQYLRAITGSADGKIRIWDIVKGNCIRVMRGNSQCDSILSMTIVNHTILVNTENNVLLMEFEPVQFEYDASNDQVVTDKSKNSLIFENESPMSKKKRAYSSVRASRMELVSTPNPKLFNDERKSALDHSARPISGKNLKNASLIHKIGCTVPTLPLNSVGNLSESALLKRKTIVNTINLAVQNHSFINVLQTTTTTTTTSAIRSSQNLNQPKQRPLTSVSYNLNQFTQSTNQLGQNKPKLNNEDISASTNRLLAINNLEDTKTFLRSQLKEMKQAEQDNSTQNKENKELVKGLNKNSNNSDETKSCLIELKYNHALQTNINDQSGVNLLNTRPQSSPSRVDTKSKVKLRENQFGALLANHHQQQQQQTQFESNAFGQGSESFRSNNLEEHEQTYVAKVFKIKETDLISNNLMYPRNVKSKLPNPKIVSQIRTASGRSANRETSASTTRTMPMPTISQETSLVHNLQPILFKPKQPALPKQPKRNVNLIRPSHIDKLTTPNNLNLMTFQEVEKVVNTLNGHVAHSEQNMEAFRTDVCKKIWLLKSKGQYHGSLLAKPKIIAPEIRE